MTRSRDLANLGDNTSTLENQGLTLIKTESFSAVSSVSVNDVFSSTYTNYKILVNTNLASSDGINFRYRVSGADNTTSNYVFSAIGYQSSNAAFNDYSAGSVSAFVNILYAYTAGSELGASFDILNPNLTKPTWITGTGLKYNTSNIAYTNFFTGRHNASTAFTGFSIYSAGATNFTGDVSVYGYKK